ncbi:hypothetical protein [Anaerovibrio sp.]|uniref:hypothetical protein n=1 Tax=Anaerovibrio sp. TaxID=1872532 RepID=UPI00388F6197
MKKRLFVGLLAFFALSLLCVMSFSPSAEAKAKIRYHVDHVRLYSPGQATIEGHFTNDGDSTGYVKWVDLDLTITATNKQQMWAGVGIRHYVEQKVPAYGIVHYNYILKNAGIPEYHKKYNWKSHTNTQWSNKAG